MSEKNAKIKLDTEILPETMSILNTLSEAYHIPIGEAVDRLAGFYGCGFSHLGKSQILTELADVLSPEHYE